MTYCPDKKWKGKEEGEFWKICGGSATKCRLNKKGGNEKLGDLKSGPE